MERNTIKVNGRPRSALFATRYAPNAASRELAARVRVTARRHAEGDALADMADDLELIAEADAIGYKGWCAEIEARLLSRVIALDKPGRIMPNIASEIRGWLAA